jgi:hypothetical protein
MKLIISIILNKKRNYVINEMYLGDFTGGDLKLFATKFAFFASH